MVLSSWVEYDADCEFPIQNLPYGVFSKRTEDGAPRCGVAIGSKVVDLKALSDNGFFDKTVQEALREVRLNKFMGLGRPAWTQTRETLQKLLSDADGTLRDNTALREKVVLDVNECDLHLPCKVGDYTDFYSSREHATNVGKMFRPNGAPLLPNWLHIPIGYHGRSSSIVVSGTPVHRPLGQTRPDESKPPVFGPCKLLDMELEMGAFVGPGNKLGEPIKMENARDHIFGLCLFNDWSARDIQKWEYVPLGPFLSKSFASTVSPWIVTLDALEPFACFGPEQGANGDPTPLPYLRDSAPGAYDINLTASVKSKTATSEALLATTNFKNMYWSVFQQLVHHSINGCNLQPGDLLGSGTISGSSGPSSFGSMLEITWRGANPVDIGNGETRKFFQDGDSVRLSGACQGDGFKVGFGPCEGTIGATPEL